MSPRPRCTTVLCMILSLLVATPLAASDQDAPVRVSERLRHKARLAAIELPTNTVVAEFTLASKAATPVRMRAVRAAPARAVRGVQAPPAPPVPPDPVPPGTINLVAGALGGGGFGGAGAGGLQNPGPPVLDHIELSARRMWVNEKGYLYFLLPFSLDPSSPSINFNKNYPGSMIVKLKVEEGETYLIDFAVKSWGKGTYRIETSGGSQEFEDTQGKLEHVLIALNATESGWTDVGFDRTGDTGHYLYSVRVDRMD